MNLVPGVKHISVTGTFPIFNSLDACKRKFPSITTLVFDITIGLIMPYTDTSVNIQEYPQLENSGTSLYIGLYFKSLESNQIIYFSL